MAERIIKEVKLEREIRIDFGPSSCIIKVPNNWGTIYTRNTKIKPESFTEAISSVLKIVRQLNEQAVSYNKENLIQCYLATTPDLSSIISHMPNGYVNVWSKDQQIVQKIVEVLNTFQAPTQHAIFVLSAGVDGISLSLAGEINEPIVYENYSSEVAAQLRSAVTWATSSKPFGRILIMSGSPGTGKSYAIRGLITEAKNVQWVIVPPDMVDHLSKPNFINTLLFERFENTASMGLIVEDADLLIAKRDIGNANSVSEVLNFGDGIMADLANIKLVLTTNQNRQNIDPAVIRRGRLYDFINFQTLPAEQAGTIYHRLTGNTKQYTEDQVLCNIYGDAFGGPDAALPTRSDKAVGQYL